MTRQPHEVSVFLDKVILLEKTKRFGAVFFTNFGMKTPCQSGMLPVY